MAPKRFLSLFAHLAPVMLWKDVGAIPYHLSRTCGWESSIAFFDTPGNEQASAEVSRYWKAVTPVRLGRATGRIRNLMKTIVFLGRCAGKYDVVNFYHDTPVTLICALVCRLFHRRVRTYVKLDMSYLELEALERDRAKPLHRLLRRLKQLLSRAAIDLYSTETRHLYNALIRDDYFRGRLQYIPNGFTPNGDEDIVRILEGKENVLLTVGRLGHEAKHNELLVDTVAMMDTDRMRGWKVVFAGPVVEPSFESHVRDTIREHPRLRDVFVFTGNIDDRERLFDLYRKSRIYCHTSRWESFGIVLAEAMYFGNYVISTDLPAARDLMADGTIGALYPIGSADALRARIEEAISGKIDLKENGAASHRRILERFDWRIIVKDLDRVLRDVCRDAPQHAAEIR